MLQNFPGMEEKNGELMIGGVSAVSLAEQFGTPLYVVNETVLRKNMRDFASALSSYEGGGRIFYASKALSVKRILKIAAEENIGADVVSEGELRTALAGGMNPENIMYHGNNKSEKELAFALSQGVGYTAVDRPEDVYRLAALSKEYPHKIKLLFRIVPGIEAHTHDYIRTGSFDSKFGMPIEEALPLMQYAKAQGLCVAGLHCHIGSQIFETEPFRDAAKLMMQFLKEAQALVGEDACILNLGGGFGIRYTEEDSPLPPADFIQNAVRVVTEAAKELQMKKPMLFFEPGRAIAGTAGSTLYTVGGVKKTKVGKTYVFIDGGMTDNPRHALYDAQYEAVIANRVSDEATQKVTIAGRLCESGDVISEGILLPPAKEGDILATFSTGAYCFSMASRYNRVPGAAMVLVGEEAPRLIVRRQTAEELLSLDL